MFVEIFDNVLELDEQNVLLEYVSNNTNWIDIPNITGDYANKYKEYSFPAKVIPSNMVENNIIIDMVNKIQMDVCKKINQKFIKNYRWKINWTTPLNIEYNPLDLIHIDSNIQHMVILYYINNSTGDTHIYDNKSGNSAENNVLNQNNISINNIELKHKISPKMGRAIVFDGNQLHFGDYPKNNDRFVLNINIATKTKMGLI